ncbi:hypothetical protein B0H13DRAFT_2371935 [Mycena leptocephala]|nr:hypothetical protein B0H13DRAFT_2371935 [Mycena leptocephala]
MSSTIHPPLEPLHSPPFGSSEMRAYVLYLCVLVLSRTSDLPQPHTNSKDLRRWRLELADQAERARLVSIQTKCEQWKAVSARYYGNHPEVKERKRVIMAEKREVWAHKEAAAAASLLFLQQSTQQNPFPPDLPDSTSAEEGDAGVSSAKEGKSDGSDNN